MKRWMVLLFGFALMVEMAGTSWRDEAIHEAAESGDVKRGTLVLKHLIEP
jgi:hypothetical protein